MRIALQTSGGRGEYELTGSYGDIAASDLIGDALTFEVRPDFEFDARCAVRRRQGKIRIRRTQTSNARHAYLIFADMLLLPVPIRERAKTTTDLHFVRKRAYAITDIDVDLVSSSAGDAVLRPTRLWLQNQKDDVREVGFAERMAVVQAAWEAARAGTSKPETLIQGHEAAVDSGDHGKIATAAAYVRKHYKLDADVLPLIAADLALDFGGALVEGGVPAERVSDDAIQDETDPAEAQRRAVAKWRKQASRGAAGRRFSELVKVAYDYRCAFCGKRYPKLESAATSGVDGAHILPWAKYDLDAVVNGLCLCKACHWAFDNGVLRLDWRTSGKRYLLSVPAPVKKQAKSANFDLQRFTELEGRLQAYQLPESQALWPSPKYLNELNAQIFGR